MYRDHKGSKKEIKAKANKITGKNVPVKKPVEKKRLKKALAKKRIKKAAADYTPENVSVENPLSTPLEPLSTLSLGPWFLKIYSSRQS
ncbi:hypothetical protein ACS0TY_024069 [Phlomoides rotata]